MQGVVVIEPEQAHIYLADRGEVQVQLLGNEAGHHVGLIVDQRVGLALLIGQLIQPDALDFFISETPQRLISAVTFSSPQTPIGSLKPQRRMLSMI